ncbi:MAG: XdhC family protein, partial [Anaerolineae bacterium]
MRDLLPQIEAWLADGRQVALATVIRTWGSSPRPAGAQMAVSQEGEIAGSVSGGCVEGAVTAAALEVLAGGEPRQLHFGVSDDTAWSVGLACGGEIDVFVQRFDPAWLPLLRAALQQSIRFALLINLTSGEWQLWQEGDRGAPPPPESGEHTLAGERVFVNWVAPPPKLIVVGGVHIAIPLVTMAKAAGFYTVVIDPRRAFGRSERFPQADEVLTSWPRQA